MGVGAGATALCAYLIGNVINAAYVDKNLAGIVSLAIVYALFPGRRSGGVLCLLLGVAIPLFKEMTSRSLRLGSNKVATYSYGIYLGHSFCIWFSLTIFHSWTLFLITIVLLPMALYHGLEGPAIRLGTRLADRVSKPRLAATPAAAQA